MGLKIKSVMATFLMVISLTAVTEAAWEGPVEIISGTWGSGNGQFAIKSGDTGDGFPRQFCISSGGFIAIADEFNSRVQTFRLDGTFIASFGPQNIPDAEGWKLGWPLVIGCLSNGVYTEFDRFTQIYGSDGTLRGNWNNLNGGLVDILSNDNFIAKTSTAYYFYSPTGQLIRTTTERPLELGRVKEKKTAAGYTYTVQYPDLVNPNTVKTYTINLPGPYERFVRDNTGNINAIAGKAVRKFDGEGREIGAMRTPANEIRTIRPGGGGFEAETEVISEYGEPVISPNGDVYTWKRTPTAYSIIKWTWR